MEASKDGGGRSRVDLLLAFPKQILNKKVGYDENMAI